MPSPIKVAKKGKIVYISIVERVLTPKERIILIRKGNELYNKGEIEKAAKIYTTTAYKDGLIRIGDYYYFDEKNPLKAFHFYLEAKYEKRIRELTERMAEIIKKWLKEDRKQENSSDEKVQKGSRTLAENSRDVKSGIPTPEGGTSQRSGERVSENSRD